jgi:hypothetical protein
MSKVAISEEVKKNLINHLQKGGGKELVQAYLHYLELKFKIQPVLVAHEKMIYESVESAIKKLESEGKLYHQTEIKIQFSPQSVNDETKRVYICPFSGKVFGDNTHPNPQDAIYEWVSKCPENTERAGGIRVKRFYVSEDPDVIKSYIPKEKPKEGITKRVFSSAISGKLYGTKNAVVEELKKDYIKPMSLVEVQNQNRFSIDAEFLKFLQDQLVEDKVAGFVESLAESEEFLPYVSKWLGE